MIAGKCYIKERNQYVNKGTTPLRGCALARCWRSGNKMKLQYYTWVYTTFLQSLIKYTKIFIHLFLFILNIFAKKVLHFPSWQLLMVFLAVSLCLVKLYGPFCFLMFVNVVMSFMAVSPHLPAPRAALHQNNALHCARLSLNVEGYTVVCFQWVLCAVFVMGTLWPYRRHCFVWSFAPLCPVVQW